MVAIFGSGYGLYGYLPAVVKARSERVLLPRRYRETFLSRAELLPFTDSIDWKADEYEALDAAKTAIIAQRPCDLAHWVDACLERKNIERLIIEKPIAESTKNAYQLIERLESSGKKFRVGYNFRHTEWGRSFIDWSKAKNADALVKIDWQFRAHHYANNLNNWKRFASHGGGALSFYGIHLLAVLAEIGYDKVLSSKVTAHTVDEAENWTAVIHGPGLPKCHIFVDTNAADESFLLSAYGSKPDDLLIDMRNPFVGKDKGGGKKSLTPTLDERLDIIVRLCNDAWQGDENYFPWYRGSIDLWNQCF